MAQQLRALATLGEILDSGHSTHIRCLTAPVVLAKSIENAPFWTPRAPAHKVDIDTRSTEIHF